MFISWNRATRLKFQIKCSETHFRDVHVLRAGGLSGCGDMSFRLPRKKLRAAKVHSALSLISQTAPFWQRKNLTTSEVLLTIFLPFSRFLTLSKLPGRVFGILLRRLSFALFYFKCVEIAFMINVGKKWKLYPLKVITVHPVESNAHREFPVIFSMTLSIPIIVMTLIKRNEIHSARKKALSAWTIFISPREMGRVLR